MLWINSVTATLFMLHYQYIYIFEKWSEFIQVGLMNWCARHIQQKWLRAQKTYSRKHWFEDCKVSKNGYKIYVHSEWNQVQSNRIETNMPMNRTVKKSFCVCVKRTTCVLWLKPIILSDLIDEISRSHFSPHITFYTLWTVVHTWFSDSVESQIWVPTLSIRIKCIERSNYVCCVDMHTHTYNSQNTQTAIILHLINN